MMTDAEILIAIVEQRTRLHVLKKNCALAYFYVQTLAHLDACQFLPISLFLLLIQNECFKRTANPLPSNPIIFQLFIYASPKTRILELIHSMLFSQSSPYLINTLSYFLYVCLPLYTLGPFHFLFFS